MARSSKFYRNASSLSMLIKLSSYVNWSTSETVASVQLPVTALFSLVEVLSHVSCSIGIFHCLELPGFHFKKTQGFPICVTLWRCITEIVSIH